MDWERLLGKACWKNDLKVELNYYFDQSSIAHGHSKYFSLMIIALTTISMTISCVNQ